MTELHLFTHNEDMELEHDNTCWCECEHLLKVEFSRDSIYYWLKL